MKHRAVIGIEVSVDEVRGAYVRMNGAAPQLAGVVRAPTPKGSIDSEGLLNPQEVGDAIRRVCLQLDPKASHVVVGMTACNMVARVMEIPPVPDSEVRAVLRGEMDHYRILPSGQSAFDYYRLPDAIVRDPLANEQGLARVLLMGAEERLVASYRAAVDAANMQVVAVEPGSIAILRALHPLLSSEDAVSTVIISRAGTDILITQKGALQFYRRVDTGVAEMRANIGAAEASGPAARPRGGLLIADPDMEDAAPSAAAAPLDPFNRQAISLLMTEVQRSIDYYSREFPSDGERMLVRFAIDAPDAGEFFDVMTQYLRSPAEIASVKETLAVAPEVDSAIHGPQGSAYTVAVGLALRGVGGDYASAPIGDLGVGDRVIVERRTSPKALLVSMGVAGFILVSSIGAAFWMGRNIARANHTLAQSRTELKDLTQEHSGLVAQLNRQKNLVDTIYRRGRPMRETLEFVAASMTRHACLLSMTIDDQGRISMSGEAKSPRVVADVMDTINLSPVLEPIRLNNLTRLDPLAGGDGLKFDMQTGLTQAYLDAPPPPQTLMSKSTGASTAAPAGNAPASKGGKPAADPSGKAGGASGAGAAPLFAPGRKGVPTAAIPGKKGGA